MNKEIKERIKDFLARFFREYEINEDEDIFSLGFVNSLFAMQLVMFLESEFDICIENADLELDKFRTINSIENFIQGKGVPNAVGSDNCREN